MKRWIVKISLLFVSVTASLYVFELLLSLCNDLPFNGYKDGKQYTWGNPVRYNSLGFRDSEIDFNKPFRIMVVGDSYVWGAGLAEGQRFTELIEDETIEAVNCGRCGYDFLDYLEVVYKLTPIIKPDIIVICSGANDTQTRQMNYSPEREQWEKKHRTKLTKFINIISVLKLKQISRIIERDFYRLLERCKVFPDGMTALTRTYELDSKEWKQSVKAVYAIRKVCEQYSTPSIFFILNNNARRGKNSDYIHPGKRELVVMSWWRQAELLALSPGFPVISIKDEIKHIKEPMFLNKDDGHPSAALNKLYAKKLKSAIEGYKND